MIVVNTVDGDDLSLAETSKSAHNSGYRGGLLIIVHARLYSCRIGLRLVPRLAVIPL